ncbi:MAG: penicillin acylase family protein, partial [Bacteroidetes bacterium]|nr:penicillin acylase family protein [Bacteroidota bacterium]
YSYYISYWYDLPFRYNRIRNMLQEKSHHSAQTFKNIQTDFKSENVKYYLPRVLNILEKQTWNGMEMDGLKYLKDWNMSMDADQVAPLVYETFFMQFLEKIFADEMGETLYKEFISDKILVRNAIHRIMTNGISPFCDDIKTAGITETLSDIVISSYKSTINLLKDQLGDKVKDWRWGSMHKISVNHYLGSVWILDKVFCLNRGPYEVGGSFHTVEPFSYKYLTPFETTHGASQRHIYVTGNWDESWSIIPTGISGIPASPYYCDQTVLYLHKKYRHDWFSEHRVKKNARFSFEIYPGK